MPGLSYSQIADAALLTLNSFVKKGSFVNMQTDLTNHVAVHEMWKKKKKVFTGGENWEFQVQMDHNHSAKPVGMFQQDSSALEDTMVTGEIPARHVNAHYIYDLREKAFQRGGAAIVDLLLTRHTAMMVSFFEYMEDMFWSKPTDSSDVLTPYGIAYWVVKNAVKGFNGGNPTGFTSGRAGIDSSTYPRFSNYTAPYTAVSKTDLLRTMREAHRVTQFRSPVNHATPDMGMGNGIYTNNDTIGLLEEVIETQNMNLGNDLASKDGQVMFKSTPITYTPKLDDDSTDPIYMLDWSKMSVGVMAGWEDQMTAPYMVPGKHLVRRVDKDVSLNMICTDPRRQTVISK